jgi:hypothetical protein
MAWSAAELRGATQAVSAVLERLELRAYRFAIEPGGEQWELTVECAVKEGWETVMLAVDIRLLLSSLRDERVQADLARSWGARLAACRTGAPPA